MRPVHVRYLREFLPAMAGYAILLIVSVLLLKQVEPGSVLRPLLALLPVVAMGFVARAIVRVIRDSDELERHIELEAIAIASLAVGLGFFSLGLLGAAGVLTLDGAAVAIWVFPSLCGVYGLAKLWASRRYR